MIATQLITGTVSGFMIIMDPENEMGGHEEIKFTDAAPMVARIAELDRADTIGYDVDPRNYKPIDALYQTIYRRDDNGEEEHEVGFDPSGQTTVGTAAYKATCKCGKTSWLKRNTNLPNVTPSGAYLCEDCNVPDDERSDHDFDNYDGGQEREY